MAASLTYLLANVQTPDGDHEKVVLTSQRNTIMLRQRGRLKVRRDDVDTVAFTPEGAATITFTDGTQWTAQRLQGGCSSCAQRRAEREARAARRGG